MAKRKQAVRQNDEEVTVAATAHVHADAVNAGHMSAKRQKVRTQNSPGKQKSANI